MENTRYKLRNLLRGSPIFRSQRRTWVSRSIAILKIFKSLLVERGIVIIRSSRQGQILGRMLGVHTMTVNLYWSTMRREHDWKFTIFCTTYTSFKLTTASCGSKKIEKSASKWTCVNGPYLLLRAS